MAKAMLSGSDFPMTLTNIKTDGWGPCGRVVATFFFDVLFWHTKYHGFQYHVGNVWENYVKTVGKLWENYGKTMETCI